MKTCENVSPETTLRALKEDPNLDKEAAKGSKQNKHLDLPVRRKTRMQLTASKIIWYKNSEAAPRRAATSQIQVHHFKSILQF